MGHWELGVGSWELGVKNYSPCLLVFFLCPMPHALIQLQDIPIQWQTFKESISQAKVVQ